MHVVADAFSVSANTVSRWRRVDADEKNRNTFQPPADWPKTLSRLAKHEAQRAQVNAARLQSLVASLADQLSPRE